MAFRVEDQSKMFPRKVNIDLYRPLIEAAVKAPNGADGLPRVVVEDYDSVKLATRAANAIRHHVKENKLDLRVSSPKGSKTVCVYKAKPPKARRKKAETAAAAPTPQSTAESLLSGTVKPAAVIPNPMAAAPSSVSAE